MKNCGLTCADCKGDIEYTDVEWHNGNVEHINLYYCDICEEYKDDDRILR